MNRQLIRIVAVAATAVLSVGIAGCASGGSGGEQTSGEDKEVNFAIIPGWNDNLDLAHLYKYVLERNGYTFDITELSEIATVYTAAARGDVDVFSSAPTSIHKVYWDEFKDDLEDLGAYYQNGAIFIAVPDYVSDVTSIEDLPAHAAEFDGTIFGIEPGSGLATTTQDVVFPAYGLGDTFEQKTSSTAAMLAELQKAVDEEKPVAVTIWNPWWVNSVFPMRRLEDPKKAYGEDYTINTVANAEFSKKSPKAAEMMSSLKLDDDEFNTLDDAIYNQFEPGEEQEAVAAWFEDHPDLLEELESYLKN